MSARGIDQSESGSDIIADSYKKEINEYLKNGIPAHTYTLGKQASPLLSHNIPSRRKRHRHKCCTNC